MVDNGREFLGHLPLSVTVLGMVEREVTYVPGLFKIFDEILVNAADNKQRDPTMDCLRVTIDPSKNMISVYNNGQGQLTAFRPLMEVIHIVGIPVEFHEKEKMYVPELIFGHLLTSSNYNDDDKKVVGGRNGFGAKLANIFSTKFIVETADGEGSWQAFFWTFFNWLGDEYGPYECRGNLL